MKQKKLTIFFCFLEQPQTLDDLVVLLDVLFE